MRTPLALAVVLALSSSAFGGNPQPAGFGFVCAKANGRLSSEFGDVLAPLMAQFGGQGVAGWGDRAVSVRLSHGGSPELVVPLSCGATGSCVWAVLASSPARSLGVVSGSVIQLRREKDGWVVLATYSGYGLGTGDFTTYEYAGGSYRKVEVGKLTPSAVDTFQSCVNNEKCCPRSAT
jgi:hypothetical protein